MSSTPLPPTEVATRRFRYRLLGVGLLILYVLGLWLFFRPHGKHYPPIEQHFMYGSIGADNVERGIPRKLWSALPTLFPEHLPQGEQAEYIGGDSGYARFGLLTANVSPEGLPIGCSQRKILHVEFVGLNCAVCHTGQYRLKPSDPPTIVLGMPSNTVDLQGYFRFLFACAADERFTPKQILSRLEPDLTWYERQIYPRLIREFRREALRQKEILSYWDAIPRFGPGRIDTFSPYKRLLFNLPVQPGDPIGTADFPTLWNQRPRVGMQLHWDGNNTSVEERNLSAAIGAGFIPPTLNVGAKKRIAEWIMDFPPPRYPGPIEESLSQKGRELYGTQCANCHGHPDIDGFPAEKVGTVIDSTDVGTDPDREKSFDARMSQSMNTLGRGYEWQFENFRDTTGYASMPLDGVWLRGPYLHNGSVPTLWHLLTPQERPDVFYRGNDVFDTDKVGFEWKAETDGPRRFFKFDTSLKGNSRSGHIYGAELSPSEKKALIEFLKTL